MKRPILTILLAAAALTLPMNAANEDLKPWPAAEEGYQRFVIRLPKLEQEEDRKVELVIGKTMKLDEQNRYMMIGKLEKKPIKGWGYSYYHLTSDGSLAGTRVGIPPDAPKVDRFITVRSEEALFRYNSKLPVVVYVPEGFEVKYRIWSAGESAPAKVE